MQSGGYTMRTDYSTYLASSEWQETRRRTLEAHHNRCDSCGGRYQLNVHHRSYQRLGHEHPDDLVVLCRPCHKAAHRPGTFEHRWFRVRQGR